MSAENGSSWCNIQPMFEQPSGWLEKSLPYFQKTLTSETSSQVCDSKPPCEAQEERWKAITGELPEYSRFVVIVPVHNEERCLPSVLGALELSDVPQCVPVSFIFVNNDSQDTSGLLLSNYLQQKGLITNMSVSTELSRQDDELQMVAHVPSTTHSRHSYYLIETNKAGKANALNLANTLARTLGISTAISIDANNWIEPDGIAKMYKASLGMEGELAQIAGATVITEKRHTGNVIETLLRPSVDRKTLFKSEKSPAQLWGNMMVWNTDWIDKAGGFPKVTMEDYAIGLTALTQGYRVPQFDVAIWAYMPNNMKDRILSYKRYIRGLRQMETLFATNDVAIQILHHDHFFIQDLQTRAREYVSWFKTSPKKIPVHLGRILMIEVGKFLGEREYKRNPKNYSWEDISSTK